MSQVRKQGRPRKGTIEWHVDHWDARPTLADGRRGGRVCLAVGMSEADARRHALKVTVEARRRGVTMGAPALAPEPGGPTVEDYATLWCAAREERGHTSVEDDRGRLRKWISPRIGKLKVASVTRRDLERLVEFLDDEVRADSLSWKTARNAWGVVTKMFADAMRSKKLALRVRDDNPAHDVEGPDMGPERSKAYLYPVEFMALMTSTRVPVRWKRLFAIATYLYARAAELEALQVEDIDLEHGTVHIHRAIDRRDGTDKVTKTNNPRRISVEPSVIPLLTELVKLAKYEERERVLVMPALCDLADRLRQYLAWSGVTRAELFANDRTRKQITFHDLRATGITWMAIRGDEPLRIMQRAGHASFKTTQGYIREAENASPNFGAVFPALPEEIFLPSFNPPPQSGGNGGGGAGRSRALVDSNSRRKAVKDVAFDRVQIPLGTPALVECDPRLGGAAGPSGRTGGQNDEALLGLRSALGLASGVFDLNDAALAYLDDEAAS